MERTEMPSLSTADLALMHLDRAPRVDGDATAYERSVPGIADAVCAGETVTGRVELLTALRDLAERELVARRQGAVVDLGDDRTWYELTAAGRDAIEDRFADLEDEIVTVEREHASEAVRVADLEAAVPERSFTEALASLTADDVLSLTDSSTGSFVGRSDALETFERVRATVADGRASTILVSGEHGMGKTEFVEAALEAARAEGFECVTGVARESVSEPYGAFRTAFDSDRETAPARLFAESESMDVDANLEQRRRSFFDEVAEYLRDRAREQPIAVFLDDLERADPATLALFETLTDTLADERVLLVGAYTPSKAVDSGVGEPGAFDEGVRSSVTRIDLDGFDATETARFVEQLVHDTGIPRAFTDAVRELTGGNPLFVEASVTYMLDEGTIDPSSRYYPTETEELPVPEEVQSVILKRIDELDPRTTDVLERGSVVGDSIAPDVLEAVVDANRERVEERLARLVDDGIWRRDDDGRLRFSSEVVRDVVHDDLPLDRRERIHVRVATALEDVYDDELSAHASEIASHYRAGGDVTAAIEWYERGGEHATAVYAYETAIESYERAVELAREHGSEERVLELLAAIGRVHVRSDDYEEAGRYFEYVLDRTDDEATRRAIAAERAKIDLDSGDFEAVVETAARVLGVEDDSPSPAVCRLLARQANAHSAMGEVSAAREVAERALEMARALESAELRALVLKVKGSIEFRHENPERAIEIGERAASAAEDADAVRILAAVYNNMAGAFAQIGDSARSVDAYENSRERWQAVGNRVGEAVPLGNLGFMLTRMGRFEEAHAVLERSVAMGERLGMDGHLVFQWSFLGELALNRGDVPRAREFAERSLSAAESLSIEPSVASARVMLGRICRLEDDDERAREHVEYVLETADSVQEEAASEARYHRGQLLREQGDVERALALHEESLESPREDGHWKAPVYQYLGLAGAQIDAGAVESAVENAECALDRVAETENVVMALAARTVLGQAKHAAADTDEARTLLRDVIADARSLGSKSYECQARTALGSVLAESGSVLKARRVLEPAVSIGEDAGLALFVRRAREILDDLDG